MAETTKPAAKAAKAPSSADIERAREFAREPFLLEGEKPADLASGTPRRRALDAALAEIDEGREDPSIEWRRQFSLLLGLERLLSEEEPHLADGTTLSAHQVDALSGTLIALLAEAQGGFRNGNGNGRHREFEELPSGEEEIEGDEDIDTDEEPLDWDEDEEREEERASDQLLDDPNSFRRFWFEHATGAGKTVAALGFVEASRTGGVLILTHRRNLVDQFHGELFSRGYKKRVTPALLGRDPDPKQIGPVTVETYQWFVRNAGNISDAYTIVICDEAHTALGEKTSAAIRKWMGPIFIGNAPPGRADRPPRHGPLPNPDLSLRPRSGRPPRRDRAAALR